MYGRQTLSLPRLTSFVKGLLIALFGAYVLQLLLERWQGMPVSNMLALMPGTLQPWQLVSYILVDTSNPLLFIFGLLVLWWVLAPFEVGFGGRRTAQLCFTCVVSAAVPAWLLGLVVPNSPPLFGSGPLWMGGLAASTYLYKDRPVSLFGLGSMSAQQFLLVIVGLSFLMFLFSMNHTHFVADLGGIAGGIGFIHYLRRPRSRPTQKKPRPPKAFRVIQGGGQNDDGRKTWLN